MGVVDKIEELEAENKRLREALTKIVQEWYHTDEDGYFAHLCFETAEAALKPQGALSREDDQ